MITTPTPIDETGTLVREDGTFVLHRDRGGKYQLQLARVPVDHVHKRVRIIGVALTPELVSVDGVSSA